MDRVERRRIVALLWLRGELLFMATADGGMNTGDIHDDREVLTMEVADEVVVHDKDDWVRIEEEKVRRFRNMVLVQ